jgi:hypothetical protein
VHGDVGLHNVIVHPTENRVAALIDCPPGGAP